MVVTDTSAENADGTYPFLRVSGNPVKLFQGHNLWGSNDLHGYVMETYRFLCKVLEVPRQPQITPWLNRGPCASIAWT